MYMVWLLCVCVCVCGVCVYFLLLVCLLVRVGVYGGVCVCVGGV